MSYPANKLTYRDVKDEFTSHGCVLLSTEYANNKEKLSFTCSCGREGEKSLIKFRDKSMCKACGYAQTGDKNGRLAIEDVKALFESKGAKLLSTEYKNNSSLLAYECVCGAKHSTTISTFKRAKHCPACSPREQWNIITVSEVYIERGCEYLSKEYKSMNEKIKYRCSCGNEAIGTFANFYYNNTLCSSCWVEKISGENSHNWNLNKTDEERILGRHYPEYRHFTKAVMARDDYTCTTCGERGGRLNVHHLNDYANHVDERLITDNGVTMCKGCHDDFHNIYGRRTITTKEQFTEFTGATI